jgi:peptidoglycan/LPS O-acetylase OafA/YrhL
MRVTRAARSLARVGRCRRHLFIIVALDVVARNRAAIIPQLPSGIPPLPFWHSAAPLLAFRRSPFWHSRHHFWVAIGENGQIMPTDHVAEPRSAEPGSGEPASGEPASGGEGLDLAPSHASALPYLPGLDGLRALAVTAVLIYHAGDDSLGGIHWLRGGYLGVEVFFVISGYLITSLLLLEHRTTGTTNFRAFWLRRARRLLAALYTLIAFWSLYAVLFLRDEVERIRGDIVAGFFYVTNWYQIATTSYVTNTAVLNKERPSVFKHLWSLAVEEQYYILWPVIFAIVLRAVGVDTMRRVVYTASIAAVVWMAALATFTFLPGSTNFSLAIDNQNLDPTRLYEGTDTRAAGILLGSWLAFVWAPSRIRGRVGRGAPFVLDAAAVVAIVWLFRLHQTTEFKSAFLYRGGMFLVSILTCVLIAATVHPAGHVRVLLGNPLFRWVGLRSYGIYLWHWPIFQVTRPGEDLPIHGVWSLILRLTLTIGAAEVSYRFIETPVRQGALREFWHRFRTDRAPLSTAWRRRWIAGIAAVTSVVALTGAAVWAAEPFCADNDPLHCQTSTPEADKNPNFNTTTIPDTTNGTQSSATGATNSSRPTQSTGPGTTSSEPTATTQPAPSRNVIAIGDSVMLGASEKLRETFPGAFVDATVSRAPVNGVARIEEIAAAGGLTNVDVVIIHLGTNGNWGANDFDRMMTSLDEIPIVVVLNTRMPRSWQNSVNAYLAEKTANYANVHLLDWNKIGNSKLAIDGDWFAVDGFHLNASGRRAYASSILNLVVQFE